MTDVAPSSTTGVTRIELPTMNCVSTARYAGLANSKKSGRTGGLVVSEPVNRPVEHLRSLVVDSGK